MSDVAKWYRLDQVLGIDRGTALNSGASIFLGGIAGWAVSAFFADTKHLELWIVVAISTVAALVCFVIIAFLTAFQKEGQDRLATISNDITQLSNVVTSSIEGSAVLVPRESIYFEMARSIREATEQVVVMTYFMYDWDNDKRTFAPVVGNASVPGLGEFYEAIYACIKDPAVEYLRVWQVPAERVSTAREKIRMESHLAKELALIDDLSPDNPDCCRVKIVPQWTTASIILIDKRTLFFNIDFYDAERQVWLSPFMLMIKDARGRAFGDMKRIIMKITSS